MIKLEFIPLNLKATKVVRLNGKGVINFRIATLKEAFMNKGDKWGVAFSGDDKTILYIAKDDVTGASLGLTGGANRSNGLLRFNGLNKLIGCEGSWYLPYEIVTINKQKCLKIDLSKKNKTRNYSSEK